MNKIADRIGLWLAGIFLLIALIYVGSIFFDKYYTYIRRFQTCPPEKVTENLKTQLGVDIQSEYLMTAAETIKSDGATSYVLKVKMTLQNLDVFIRSLAKEGEMEFLPYSAENDERYFAGFRPPPKWFLDPITKGRKAFPTAKLYIDDSNSNEGYYIIYLWGSY